VKEFLNIWRRW